MTNSFLVEVNSRLKGHLKAGEKIESSYQESGFGLIECLNTGALYRLEGSLSSDEVSMIAREILCDPVAEEFSVDLIPQDIKTFFLDIWYKKGVTDSVGESVLKATKEIGITSLTQAAHGQRIHLRDAAGQNSKKALAQKIVQFAGLNLLNPLVQECKITGI